MDYALIFSNPGQQKKTLKSNALPRPVVIVNDDNQNDNFGAEPCVAKLDELETPLFKQTRETGFMEESVVLVDEAQFIDIEMLEEQWSPALQNVQPCEETVYEKPIVCDASTQVNFFHRDQGTQTETFSISTLFKIDPELNAFTGINSFAFLTVLINCISTLRVNMKKTEGHFSLNIKDRIIMTLMELKLNLPYVCLSVLFQVTANTCKNNFIMTLNELCLLLSPIIRWPSKSEIRQNMPTCFSKYKDTRVVLDCTEVPIKRTKCLKCRLGTYSNYKGTQTLKFLLGVTPSGLTSFVSNAFGGRVSDKQIVVKSQLLEKMIPNNDSVIVDKGFIIDCECAAYRTELIRPPFLRKKKQFSKAEAEATAPDRSCTCARREGYSKTEDISDFARTFATTLNKAKSSNNESYQWTCES
ncbi:uncharacterized protein LOC107038160 [Diachasma alloeum]|uniref:uncharacterized protein LOC107038160 n=1 Tax=Diachasma alloeum TaxID=454923 RepID=UPI000738113B|nr:uncharacterized protein LOC107038160 [Diachasma alloeum]